MCLWIGWVVCVDSGCAFYGKLSDTQQSKGRHTAYLVHVDEASVGSSSSTDL